MKTIYTKTPLGIAKITGDHNGIFSVHIEDDDAAISTDIPLELQEAVNQLVDSLKGSTPETLV